MPDAPRSGRPTPSSASPPERGDGHRGRRAGRGAAATRLARSGWTGTCGSPARPAWAATARWAGRRRRAGAGQDGGHRRVPFGTSSGGHAAVVSWKKRSSRPRWTGGARRARGRRRRRPRRPVTDRRPGTTSAPSGTVLHVEPGGLEVADQRGRLGRPDRGPVVAEQRRRPDRRRRSGPAPITSSRSTVCSTSLEQVAGQQHRAAARGVPAQQVAHPADALGVQPVGRLVEHQHRRVGQQRAGDPEPLPHAERVAADPAPAGVGEPDQLEHLVHPRRPGRRWSSASSRRCVRPVRPGCTADGVEQRADDGARVGQLRVRPAVDQRRARRGRRPGRSSSASSSSCRRRSGPRKPVTVPGSSVERDVVDDGPVAVLLGQSADRDHGGLRLDRLVRSRRREPPRQGPVRVGRRPRIRWPDGRVAVIRKLTSHGRSRRPTRTARSAPYARGHGASGRACGRASARAASRSRRRRRCSATVAVGVGAGTPDDRARRPSRSSLVG